MPKTLKKISRPKVCFDRILPRKVMAPFSVMRMPGGRMKAIALKGKTWMNGTTLHVRFMEGTSREKAKVREQASWWTDVANIRMEFDDSPNADIRIAFDPEGGSWSYVGTDCKEIPSDQPTLNLGFLDGGTAAHELGHAIGLAHEHSNPAGGIQWNEEVVIADCAREPNCWTAEETRHNVLEKYSADQIMGTEFDPDSIMLYFFPPEWTLNGVGTKQNNVLSKMDKEFVSGPHMYPMNGPTVKKAVELEVDAKTKTAGCISAAAEEDLFSFSADKQGPYVIETEGETDVAMKLFGPDSETALVAEDDDSGFRLNARIAAMLMPGTYFVQIRHYDPAGGCGDYSVGVTRG